jgi:hypothetical protein
MKYGQKLKLGDAHVTPRNIEEVQASKLGDAPRHPFFIGKSQVIFQDTIFFIALYSMHFSWSVFTFAFRFILFCLLQ